MAARYVSQFEFTNPVYMPNCPVALEKGAVLFDTKTNTYFLQLKFANLGAKGITSIRACIVSVNSAKKSAYPAISVNYDEFAATGVAFGTKKLTPLPNNNAVRFGVYVLEVKTADGQALAFAREQYVKSGNSIDITKKREKLAKTQEENRQSAKREVNTMWGAKLYRIALAAPAILLLLMAMRPLWHLRNVLMGGQVLGGFWRWWFGTWLHREFVPLVPAASILGFPINPLPFFLVGILILAVPLYLWYSVWASIGTPKILKNSVRLMIFMGPVIYVLNIISGWRQWNFFLSQNHFFDAGFWAFMQPRFFGLSVVVLFLCAAAPFVYVFINTRKHDKSLSLKKALMFW